MSIHFFPGEYALLQATNEVGRLVAVDSPTVEEHWFLYHDVRENTSGYATYTAPSPRDQAARTGVNPSVFHERTVDVEWTLKYLGPPPASPATCMAGLSIPGNILYVLASVDRPIVSPGGQGPGAQPPDWGHQIFSSEYVLENASKELVGHVLVDGASLPILGTREKWSFWTADDAVGKVHARPATTVGAETRYFISRGTATVPASAGGLELHCTII